MFHHVGVGGIIICTPGLSPGAIVVKALQAKGIIIFTPFFYLKITPTNNLPQLIGHLQNMRLQPEGLLLP